MYFYPVICIILFLLVEFLNLIPSPPILFNRLRSRTKFSIIFRTILIIYTPTSFAVFLQFLNFKFDNELNKIELILAFLALILILIPLPLFMLYLFNCWKGGLGELSARNKYGTLYDGLIVNALMK